MRSLVEFLLTRMSYLVQRCVHEQFSNLRQMKLGVSRFPLNLSGVAVNEWEFHDHWLPQSGSIHPLFPFPTGIWEFWFLWKAEKPKYPGKNLWCKDKNQRQTH